MSAEELRTAAETLQERAKAATPGPWDVHEGWSARTEHGCVYVYQVGHEHTYVVQGGAPSTDTDAPYIATMHPGVGLALAKLFDTVATALEAGGNADAQVAVDTLALARQVNGGDGRG